MPCPERISFTPPIFREIATESYRRTLKAVENKEIDDLVATSYALLHAQILERTEVICYSDGLTEGDKEDLGFNHAKTLEGAIEMAFESQGKEARVGILKYGGVLPVAKSGPS